MVSRFTLTRSLKIAGILCVLYFLAISITAVAVYKYQTDNRFTRAIQALFPYPAAIVNGEVISLNRFQTEVAAKEALADRTNLNTSKADIEKNVINQLVTRTLYSQALKEHGITIQDKDIEASLQGVYTTIGGQENLARFLDEEYGKQLSVADFRLLIKAYLEQSALENQLLAHASIRHILIAIPSGATSQQVNEAKARLLDVKGKITDSSKFSDIAKEYSEDTATRDKGGDLGTSTRGQVAEQFSPEFEEAIFNLPVGKVSDPIRSKYGWHLIIVDKREGQIDKSLEQLTEELRTKAKIALFVGK